MSLCMFWAKAHMFQHRMHGCVTFSTVQTTVATVGIDFGCKNSRIAIVGSLVPQLVQSEVGRFTPSFVTLTQLNSHAPYPWGLQHLDRVGKHAVVGEFAKRKMLRQPSEVVFNIKKIIGKQFSDCDIREMRKRLCFSIIDGPSGEAWVEIHGMKFSPVEIASAIFAKLRDIVLMHQFHHTLKAVISVPAFFNEQQREDIMSAGNRAGLEILQLIDEPIAAALSSKTIEEGNIVVFGMGAGSYSITVLHVSDTNFEIKTQFGDPSLGGDQFDNILVDYFVGQIIELHSIDIRGDKYAMMILAEAVEQAKVELSSQPKVTVSIPCLIASAQGPIDLNITISRPEFEKLVGGLIGQIKDECRSILKEVNITHIDIDEIIFSGGMTRVPKIQRIIYDVFGKHQSTSVNPEEAVAIGCAIQAALIIEDQQKPSEDMIPLSIGIESAEGIFTRVIPRHTPVPTKRTVKIPSCNSYGECIHVGIFLGEHVMVRHNIPLGEVELINNQSSSYQGSVDFELTFEVDEDYVVKVSTRRNDDDDMRRKVVPAVCQKVIFKQEMVNKAVRKALLDWAMHGKEIHARVRNLARYIMNTLDGVLSARKDELPKDLCEDAAKALVDLRMALDGNVVVLKDKMLSAKLVELEILKLTTLSISS